MIEEDKKQEGQEFQAIENKDWFLQSIVKMVNDSPSHHPGFGLTLNVGGLLICGTLVSFKEYFEGVGKEFADSLDQHGGSPESIKWIQDFFNQFGNIPKEPSEEKKEKQIPILPNFIHLKDARFYFPGQQPIPENRPVWWRGSISQVDGFLFGTLSAVIAPQG